MKWVAVIALAVMLGACTPTREAVASPTPSRSVILTTPGAALIQPCANVGEIQALLDVFASAANRGDAAAVAAAVSTSAQWFSITTSQGHEAAYGHDDIARHLLQMHSAGDRFVTTPTPDQFTLEAWDGAGHFGLATFTFERGGRTIRLFGKGSVYCGGTARGVAVMSLGGSN